MWAPLLNAFVALLTAIVPVIATQMWRMLEERIKASAVERLGAAASRAGGQVLDAMASPSLREQGPEVAKELAIRQAVENLAKTMGETVARLGGDTSKIEAMVRGEVGKLLAPQMAVAVDATAKAGGQV